MQKPSIGGAVPRLLTLSLAIILVASILTSTPADPTFKIISTGNIADHDAEVSVTIDFNQILALNNLSLGVNIGHDFDFAKWRNDPTLRAKVAACNFHLIRLFVHEIQPCTQWNETTHKGEYSWELFDRTIERVLEMGAEPLLVVATGNYDTKYWVPSGMIGDYDGSRFPSNESCASFCAELVKHCNIDKKWGIKYWEIWNEPNFYDTNETTDQSYVDYGLIANFTKTFNNAAQSMHDIDPTILCGHGFSAIKSFFDYFMNNTEQLGFFSIHDYDAHATKCYRQEYYKDEDAIMADAPLIGYQKPGLWKTYTPIELQQKWNERHLKELPVLITETNVNSALTNGTDPRIQTIFGATWYAEKIRSAILSNITYCAYFMLASDNSDHWNTTEPTHGAGFGMMNSTSPYEEWYPYFTNYLLGNELSQGYRIYNSSTSDFNKVTQLAWTTKTHYNILLIGKTTANILTHIEIENPTLSNQTTASIFKIDGNYKGIQSTYLSLANNFPVSLNGYSVVLIKIPLQA